MKEQIRQAILVAVKQIGIGPTQEEIAKIRIDYPEASFGDYSCNAGLILAKQAKMPPMKLAQKILEKIDQSQFEKVEVAKPGFINFWVKNELLLEQLSFPSPVPPMAGHPLPQRERENLNEKILLEYFQPNIAKPLHIGHMRTAIIGDCLKRMLLYLGCQVESDTHMGDWGTQFGFLILAVKKYGEVTDTVYAELNAEAEKDESIREVAKQEFVKLEKGDAENRKIWQGLVETSMEEFLKINDTLDILPFDHHWPESFYEDKMPAVLDKLKSKKLLVESQGAQIVNLEGQGLGVAVIVKSDGGTTYLLRDLATFIYVRSLGFTKHLYVVDNRQAQHYKQLFAILKLMEEMNENEGQHVDYGFMSFKGEVLSTRKGNIVLLEDVLKQAEEKVAQVIAAKNPDLKNKQEAIKAIAKGAIKYFDLSHNRHSDIEFDWDQALNFEGNSGPYLQYTYARLASILRKTSPTPSSRGGESKNSPPRDSSTSSESPRVSPRGEGELEGVSFTERRILFLLSIFNEMVTDSMQEYLPNIFANYLYELTELLNRFYHESPVIKENDENKKAFRLQLVSKAKEVLGKGLDLLGIQALDEM